MTTPWFGLPLPLHTFPGTPTEQILDRVARQARAAEERRAAVAYGTPEQAAGGLRPYLDAGFTGFTFNNNVDRTGEQIAVLGELLRPIA